MGPADARRAFVSNKVQTTIQSLENLKKLHYQDGLLLLRQCICPELRHLLRWVKTDDIRDVWEPLDAKVLELGEFLSGLAINPTVHEPNEFLRRKLLYNLPIRDGGLGLLSYEQSIEAARKGSDALAGSFLTSININHSLPILPCTQRSEMMLVHQINRETFLGLPNLTTLQRALYYDQKNSISPAWMYLLPLRELFTFTDDTISAGLRARTLTLSSPHALCTSCFQENVLNHAEGCAIGKALRTQRHDQLLVQFRDDLRSINETSNGNSIIQTEIELPNSAPSHNPTNNNKRIDLRIIGTLASNRRINDYDLAITAITAHKVNSAPESIRTALHESRNPSELSMSNLTLENMVNRKRTKYAGVVRHPFIPLVITTGGTCATEMTDFLKGPMKRAYINYKLTISAHLLRYKALIQ